MQDWLCLSPDEIAGEGKCLAIVLIPVRTRISNSSIRLHNLPDPHLCDRAHVSVSKQSPLCQFWQVLPPKFPSSPCGLFYPRHWPSLGLNQSSWEVVKVEYLQIAKSGEMQNPIYHKCIKNLLRQLIW